MIFERIEDKGLAQYSYIVGCAGAGRVAVVDPRRDIDVYTDWAAANGMAISHVLETHIHADFASGARELAARTGAELLLSGHDTGEIFETKFPHTEFRDGDAFEIGVVRIQALHTPGHTPEHISFLVFDGARSTDVPMLFLTGDFLFVGSLGRPDLLGEDAKRELAEKLHDSATRKIAGLPDGLEIHPGHGAGSMCGSGMSGRPTSTLGFERLTNPYLMRGLTRERFLERILGSAPPFPPYYRRMKAVNSEGPALLDGLPGRKAVEPAGFLRLVEEENASVIDLRRPDEYGRGHVRGAFGIGAGSGFSIWASWLVPHDRPILLVAHDADQAAEAIRGLVRVGLDDVRGHLDGGMDGWTKAGYPVASTPLVKPAELAGRLSGDAAPLVVDVRNDSEWEAGHIAGARHIMGGYLADRVNELKDGGRPIALFCGSGYRSTAAVGVLERAGFGNLLNVDGGVAAWKSAGLPLTTD